MRRKGAACLALALTCSPVTGAETAVSKPPGCPGEDWSVPASFSYKPRGRARSAEAAIVLPMSFERLSVLIDDVGTYPEWVLLDPDDGSPLLHDASFNDETGTGAISVGASGDTRIEGLLTRRDAPERRYLRLEMLGGERVTEAAVEITAVPSTSCAGASVVHARATWKVSFLTHLFANDLVLSTPALLLLAFRDDLAARVLAEREELRAALLDAVPSFEELPVSSGREPSSEWTEVSLLHFEPGVVRADPGHTERLRKLLRPLARGKKVKGEAVVNAFFKLMSSQHLIVGYHAALSVESIENPARLYLLSRPGDTQYRLDVTSGGFFFWCSVVEQR